MADNRIDKISELAEMLLQEAVADRISEDAVYEFTRRIAGQESQEWNAALERLDQYLQSVWRSGEMERLPWDFSVQTGRLLALLDLIKISAQLRTDREQLQSDARGYLGRLAVFQAINEKQGISHGELARRAGMSDSALSQFMNRIEHKHYLYYRKTGRNKYYYMLEDGRDLLKAMEELWRPVSQIPERCVGGFAIPKEFWTEVFAKEWMTVLPISADMREEEQGMESSLLAKMRLKKEILESHDDKKTDSIKERTSVKLKFGMGAIYLAESMDENEEWNLWRQNDVGILKRQGVC